MNENLTKMKHFYIMVSVSVFGHARTVSILKCVHDIKKLTASLQTLDHSTLIYIVKGTVRTVLISLVTGQNRVSKSRV